MEFNNTMFSEDCPVCGHEDIEFTVRPAKIDYKTVIACSDHIECPMCGSTFAREYRWDMEPSSERWLDITARHKENGWEAIEEHIASNLGGGAMRTFARGDRVYKTSDMDAVADAVAKGLFKGIVDANQMCDVVPYSKDAGKDGLMCVDWNTQGRVQSDVVHRFYAEDVPRDYAHVLKWAISSEDRDMFVHALRTAVENGATFEMEVYIEYEDAYRWDY